MDALQARCKTEGGEVPVAKGLSERIADSLPPNVNRRHFIDRFHQVSLDIANGVGKRPYVLVVLLVYWSRVVACGRMWSNVVECG